MQIWIKGVYRFEGGPINQEMVAKIALSQRAVKVLLFIGAPLILLLASNQTWTANWLWGAKDVKYRIQTVMVFYSGTRSLLPWGSMPATMSLSRWKEGLWTRELESQVFIYNIWFEQSMWYHDGMWVKNLVSTSPIFIMILLKFDSHTFQNYHAKL